MIKANELRVGSWINQLVKTNCGIHSAPFCCSEDFLEVLFASRDYENYEGIILTPEILEQCGFTEVLKERRGIVFAAFGDYEKGDFSVNSGHSEFWYWSAPMNTKLQYLHQLQNLYFALTDKELTLNITSPASASPQL